MQESVVTRFAPSPTGLLHIGGARTALFNYLFSKHYQGKFLLRIENTDLKRSTKEATNAIYEGLNWLGLTWDEEPVSQVSRRERHLEVAQLLMSNDMAYKCFCTPEELKIMREKSISAGGFGGYNGKWRNVDASKHPPNASPAIRLKTSNEGKTSIKDLIQGNVEVSNKEIDDMVLVRSDGTPTYMLAVAVDDHDMKITHVIRGDDHLTNTFRQIQIYQALGWKVPYFAHIPLIHGSDGKKLSKRHGALGVNSYKEDGILPQALNNYLLRLGWSHKDHEIINLKEAIDWFELKNVGKSPSRFDIDKLNHLNAHYISSSKNDELLKLITPILNDFLGFNIQIEVKKKVLLAMDNLKVRAKTLNELAEDASIYAYNLPITIEEKALTVLDQSTINMLNLTRNLLEQIADWTSEELEAAITSIVNENKVGFKEVAQPIRIAITGSLKSPSIHEVLANLGRDTSLERIDDFLRRYKTS